MAYLIVSDGPSLMLTLQSLLSFDVILQPTSDLTQLAGKKYFVKEYLTITMKMFLYTV